MSELLSLSASTGGEKLAEIGVHLNLLGALALFCGALRFLLARGTAGRVFLLAGAALFALGVTVESLEILGLYEQTYYPGWDPADFRIAEPGGGIIEVPTPTWWEAGSWWLARLARLGGLLGMAAGFVMEGRRMLRGAPGTAQRRRA